MASRAQKKANQKRTNEKKQKVLTDNVLVERDYSQGVETRFSTSFPEILTQRGVTEDRFIETVSQINDYFAAAEEMNCSSTLEGIFGCLSFWSIFLFMEPHSYTIYRDMRRFIDQENRDYYLEKGLEVLDPISNGLIGLEFKVLKLPE